MPSVGAGRGKNCGVKDASGAYRVVSVFTVAPRHPRVFTRVCQEISGPPRSSEIRLGQKRLKELLDEIK